MWEDQIEEPGYNLIMKIPVIDCMKDGVDIDKKFEIDESLAEGHSFFKLMYRDYNAITVIDETLKNKIEEMNFGGLYMIPVSEINDRIAFDLNS